jgi:hypothetical protein
MKVGMCALTLIASVVTEASAQALESYETI